MNQYYEDTRQYSDAPLWIAGTLGAGIIGGALWLAYKSEKNRIRALEDALRRMHNSISFSGYDRADERVVKKFFSDLDKLVRDIVFPTFKDEVADYAEAEAVLRMHERRFKLLKDSFKDAIKAVKRSSPNVDEDVTTLKSFYRDFLAMCQEDATPNVNRSLNRPQTVNVHHRYYSNIYERAKEDDLNYDRELAKRGLGKTRSDWSKSAAQKHVSQARLRGKVGGRVRGGLAGAAGGALAGAAAGTAVMPILGTIAGGAIGAGAGLLGGASAGGNYYANKKGKKALRQIQNQRQQHLHALDTEALRNKSN